MGSFNIIYVLYAYCLQSSDQQFVLYKYNVLSVFVVFYISNCVCLLGGHVDKKGIASKNAPLCYQSSVWAYSALLALSAALLMLAVVLTQQKNVQLVVVPHCLEDLCQEGYP